MITSREEALSFLSKLKTESVPVCVTYISPGWVFGLFLGSIAAIESDCFMIQQSNKLPFVVSLKYAHSLEYAEVSEFIRAVPEHEREKLQETMNMIEGTIQGILVFNFQSGTVAVMEIKL